MEAKVVFQSVSRKLVDHRGRHFDAGFVFAFIEQRGQQHAADTRNILGVRVGSEEKLAVPCGGEDLADDRCGANEVVEVVLAHLGVGIVEFELLVGRVGPAGVVVDLVQVGGGGQFGDFRRLGAAEVGFERLEVFRHILGVDHAPDVLDALLGTEGFQPCLGVVKRRLGGRHQLIQRHRSLRHVGADRIVRQLKVQLGEVRHLERLQGNVRAILGDEIEERLLVVALDRGPGERLETGDDGGGRSGEVLLVGNGDFQVCGALRDIPEFEVGDAPVDVERAPLEDVQDFIALRQVAIELADGQRPILCAECGFTPFEQRSLAKDVASGEFAAGIRITSVAEFKRLHRLVPPLQFQFADPPAVVEHAELRAVIVRVPLCKRCRRGVEIGQCVFPPAFIHRFERVRDELAKIHVLSGSRSGEDQCGEGEGDEIMAVGGHGMVFAAARRGSLGHLHPNGTGGDFLGRSARAKD